MKCECESVNAQFPTFLEMLSPGWPPNISKSFADRYTQINDDADEGMIMLKLVEILMLMLMLMTMLLIM